MNWFKVYIDAVLEGGDGSLAKLTECELGGWVKLMGLAGRLDEGGRFEVNGVPLTDHQIVAMTKPKDAAAVAATIRRCLDPRVGLMERNDSGVLHFKNWKVYQSEYEAKKHRYKKGRRGPKKAANTSKASTDKKTGQSDRTTTPDKVTVLEERRQEEKRINTPSDGKAFVVGTERSGMATIQDLLRPMEKHLNNSAT